MASNQHNFEKGRQFIQEYFKNISEMPLLDLQNYLNLAQQAQKDQEDAAPSQQNMLNQIKEGTGKAAIHIAAARGDVEIFKYLEGQGADVNQLDERKNNALMISVQHEQYSIIQYLLDNNKTDVNYTRDTVTALHLASQLGSIPIIELLISSGANVNAVSNYGTPLQFAAANRQNWSAIHLMKKGADLNITSGQMPSFLHLLIDQDNNEVFEVAFQEHHNAIDVNVKDSNGCSALQVCAEKGNLAMLETLLGFGAEVDYENQNQTALDIAVQFGHWNCVDKLRKIARRKEPVIIPPVKPLTQADIQQTLEDVLALKKEGNIHLQQGDFNKAKEAYTKALTLSAPINETHKDDVAPICTNLAQTLLKLELPGEALEVCKLCRQIKPEWVKTYYYEGLAYEKQQEYGEAAASFFDALKLEHNPLFKQLFDKAIKDGKAHHQRKQQN